jgi:hypothetical protein
MEEHPYIPYTPPVPVKKEYKGLKRGGLVVLALLLIGALGYGVYTQMQNEDLQANLASEQSTNKALLAENNNLKSSQSANPATATISETLPNGKIVSYPNTKGNRSIIWWSVGASSEGSGNSIILSHKGFQAYLSTLDSDLLASVCGTDGSYSPNVIAAGTFDTESKKFEESQGSNCVSQLASEDNVDTSSRASAKKVLTGINADIQQFVKSVSIK